jgi:hypothetical protein
MQPTARVIQGCAAADALRSAAGTTIGVLVSLQCRQDLLMKNFTAIIERDADTGL